MMDRSTAPSTVHLPVLKTKKRLVLISKADIVSVNMSNDY